LPSQWERINTLWCVEVDSAVNTQEFGDTLYLVFYETETEQEFQLFYNNTTQNTEITKPLNTTLSIDDLTVFLPRIVL